jgi:hypothetical protein
MNNTYAIIDEISGVLVNIVIWDGNLETWQPPIETKAILASEVDFESLPVQEE